MKYFINVINCLLILLIPLMVITGVKIDRNIISTTMDVKKINSLKLNTLEDVKKMEEKKEEKVEDKEILPEEKIEEEIEKVTEKSIEEQTENIKIVEEKPITDVIQTLKGSMSGYGPDCAGCRGVTYSGYNIKNSIYYPDSTYGQVRILSGDRSLKLGSIIRVRNSKLGEFLGIVLDRGSSVGIGKSHLFDLVFSSEKEALSYEVSYNVTFEVLRNGY